MRRVAGDIAQDEGHGSTLAIQAVCHQTGGYQREHDGLVIAVVLVAGRCRVVPSRSIIAGKRGQVPGSPTSLVFASAPPNDACLGTWPRWKSRARRPIQCNNPRRYLSIAQRRRGLVAGQLALDVAHWHHDFPIKSPITSQQAHAAAIGHHG